MKFIPIAVCLLLHTAITFGQSVGIGTKLPNASAALDITSANKGFLPPRIALKSATDITTIPTPAAGLLIYNTATTTTSQNSVNPGYYYFNGSVWKRLATGLNLNAIINTSAAPVTACASGGTKIEVGLDSNLNGKLDSSEINNLLTRFVCNGLQGQPGTNAAKMLTGYVDPVVNYGSGYILTRSVNHQYAVSWPAGSFKNIAMPLVFNFAGAVALASWTAGGDGSGSFTTMANAGTTIWFTITEIK